MGTPSDSLLDAMLEAFREGEPTSPAMQDVIERIRTLSDKEQSTIGVPSGATDTELFEYVMRTGGVLLLAVDTKKH